MSNSHDSSNLTEVLCSIIKTYRTQKNLTQEDLADHSGLHRTFIGLLEKGERGLTVHSANQIAVALGVTLSSLISEAELLSTHGEDSLDESLTGRVLPETVLINQENFTQLTGLPSETLLHAVEHTYSTFDLIDNQLLANDAENISNLVELANLSSMLGNILGAGIASNSNGLYVRNRPHAFPDLLPQREYLPQLEIKTALETNKPKGHLAKPGTYLTFRYVLGNEDGSYTRGKENRGSTAWIWEIRVGELTVEDFTLSNTAGDSGKTATIKTESLKNMTPVFFDNRFFPHARPWGGLSGIQ